MATYRTGGEIDSQCGKCKMTLAHTILAMVGDKVVRVQCNTCGGQHNHKGGASSSSSSSSSTSSAARPRAASSSASGGGGSSTARASAAVSKITVSFEQLLGQKDLGSARRYSPKDTYAAEDVIDHPNFGYGIVNAVRGDKVEVIFKMDTKTLVHGRGGAPAQKPTFERPKATASGPADKPMAANPGAGAEAGAGNANVESGNE